MRVTAFAGLLACTVIVMANGSSVSAESLDLLKLNQQPVSKNLLAYARADVASVKTPEPPAPPQPIVHEVKDNETLSSIAEQHGTTWTRIFNKNEQIVHPDLISAGEKITIPFGNEELKDRPLPEPPQVIEEAPVAASPSASSGRAAVASANTSVRRGPSGRNTYTPGNCTWYAFEMRSDLSTTFGNADTWVDRAAAQGFATGSEPRAGAIGQQGMHVVYVERVNGDGTVFISEMNYQGLYVVSTRTVPASNFRYIY